MWQQQSRRQQLALVLRGIPNVLRNAALNRCVASALVFGCAIHGAGCTNGPSGDKAGYDAATDRDAALLLPHDAAPTAPKVNAGLATGTATEVVTSVDAASSSVPPSDSAGAASSAYMDASDTGWVDRDAGYSDVATPPDSGASHLDTGASCWSQFPPPDPEPPISCEPSATLPEAGSIGAACFPACIEALLARCPLPNDCRKRAEGSGIISSFCSPTTGTRLQSEPLGSLFQSIIETKAFGPDGQLCYRVVYTNDLLAAEKSYTWYDACGNPVATGTNKPPIGNASSTADAGSAVDSGSVVDAGGAVDASRAIDAGNAETATPTDLWVTCQGAANPAAVSTESDACSPFYLGTPRTTWCEE
jgi:hypothetical protein